jgi:uncharacterized protein YgiM (DUF1202 family)
MNNIKRTKQQNVLEKAQATLNTSVNLLSKCTSIWLYTIVALFVALAMFRVMTAQAASLREINQTVPPLPKETPLPATPVPEATATPGLGKPEETIQPEQPQQPEQPDNNNTGNSGGGSGGAPSSAVQVSSSARLTGTITVASLNIRTGPGPNYPLLGTVKKGTLVEVLQRTQAGDWWQICCAANTSKPGWVSARFVQTKYELRQALGFIPVVTVVEASSAQTNTLGQSNSNSPTNIQPIANANSEAKIAPVGSLDLAAVVSTLQPLQGEEVQVSLVITNLANTDALNVEVRSELPTGLRLGDSRPGNNGVVQQVKTTTGQDVLSLRWPKIAAKGSVNAVVTLRVGQDVANGTVLDSLIYAGAANFNGVTIAITLAMPPANLPDF